MPLTVLTAFLCDPAHAQLRIAHYNVAGVTNSSALTTVLTAIKDEQVNGVSKPIDVLMLNEVESPDVTTILDILNTHGAGTYAAGNLGSTTGAGSVGMVYRVDTVDLVAQQQVVDTSNFGAARGVMRYTLRPDGYGAEADFYIYGSHYKSSDTAADADRRNVEAAAIRANSNALGEGKHVIYTGDFNIYRSTELMWATLTASGAGQAFDPVNQVGNWHDGAAFRPVHTQNPAGSGFVGGGMDDRFDWQMVTSELQDNEGMSILAGSYHAFGNNNTHAINGHINTGTGASTAVLNALGSASDHLPVVAQYQVPAKMDVQFTDIPDRVLVGANVNLTATVRNSAGDTGLVTTVVGADELDYTGESSGAISGSFTSSDLALGSGNVHEFVVDTSTPGSKSGGASVNTTSPQVPIPGVVNLQFYSVIDHANPSLTFLGDTDTITYDFGTIALGAPAPFFDYEVRNIMSAAGATSALEFDGFDNSGDAQAFNLEIEEGEAPIPAGQRRFFSTSFSTESVGAFSATMRLLFSDEDLLGEAMHVLTMNLTGTIVAGTPGDFDNDGDVDGRDFLEWQLHPNVGELADWQENYGVGPLVAAVAVPEPSAVSLCLAVMGLAGIARRK